MFTWKYRITAIQHRNTELFTARAYRDQLTTDRLRANFRYEVLPKDFTSLYRQHLRNAYEIDITIKPEHNIDNWLDPASQFFKPQIHEAIFYYRARMEKEDRFKVCICTPEMKQAAWQLVHAKQLVLDGTFGITTSRLLLWIAMGIDDCGRGIPVALFLFSAPTGNRATHAGYNTAILTELLGTWRDWMGKQGTRRFEPAASITDTDTKERGALLSIWPRLILLLCKFHVRQCWMNKRTALIPKKATIWTTDVQRRLQHLEQM